MDDERDAEEIKEIGKKAGKSVKKGIGAVLKKIPFVLKLKILGGVILFLLALGLISILPWAFQEFFVSSIVELFNGSSSGGLDTSIESVSVDSSIVKIEDGKYKLKNENMSKDILKQLEEQKVSTEILGMITDSNFLYDENGELDEEQKKKMQDMIDKYIKAEANTTLLKIRDIPEILNDADWVERLFGIDGSITVKRADASMSTSNPEDRIYTLKYEPYDKFIKEPKRDKFSITEDFELCILGANGNEIENIPYREYIENYAVPFNFFITLHSITQDKEFMDEVLKMVLDDLVIELTYVETKKVFRSEYKCEQKELTKTDVTDAAGTVLVKGEFGAPDIKSIPNPLAYIEKLEEQKEVYSGVLCLSKVNNWFVNMERGIKYKYTPPESGKEWSDDPEVIDTSSINYTKIDKSEAITKHYITTGKREILKYTKGTTEMHMFNITQPKEEIKVDDFVDLIKEHPQAYDYITTSPSSIFINLNRFENTQRLEKIMRYVMYKLTDVEYGVLEEDLKYLLFNYEEFKSQFDFLKEYIIYWENQKKIPTKNEAGDSYVIEKDDKGNLVIRYGINLKDYEHELNEAGFYSIVEGGEISIEEWNKWNGNEWLEEKLETKIKEIEMDVKNFIQDLEMNELEDGKLTEEAELNLTPYQMNALISRAYDLGGVEAALKEFYGSPEMDFVDSYKKYWKADEDDLYKKQDSNADFSHELYVQYMSKPSDESISSESVRRKSEWRLFQTGYYDVLDEWSTSENAIVSAADVIHKYMEKYEYTYCADNGGHECGKTGSELGLSDKSRIITHGDFAFPLDFKDSIKYRKSACAKYVFWVLYEAGVCTEEDRLAKRIDPSVAGIAAFLQPKGYGPEWEKILVPMMEQLKPGDILFYNGGSGLEHIDIYAGFGGYDENGEPYGYKYNAGSGGCIRAASPEKFYMEARFIYCIRPPEE